MNITILITGGAGNIGSAIANKLAEDADDFIAIHKTTLSHKNFK
jgi:nucleoside-diphosphate-sugar epimerase